MTAHSLTRRGLLTGAFGAAAAGLLAACGDDSAPAPSGGASTAPAGTFPAAVRHQFGTTTVDAAPATVVSLGWGDADALLALGVVPVGILDWFRAWPQGVGPWAQDRLGGAKPTVLTGPEINFETVATLRPDLVTHTKSDNVKATWEQLEKVAPTLSGPPGTKQYSTSLRDQTLLIAEALGRRADGEALVTTHEKLLADTRAANPAFAGKTIAVGAVFDGQYGAYLRGDGRVDFLEAIGFTNAPAIEKLKQDSFYVPVSAEQAGLLDADITMVFGIGAGTELRKDKVLGGIPSARAGRLIIVDDADLVNAFSTYSVLSTPYTLGKVIPLLNEALA